MGAAERVVIRRRGRPAAVLVSATPDALERAVAAPLGLAAVAGALADWADLEAVVEEISPGRET